MKLTISVETLSNIKWLVVDASYNTHEDCKGHTGGMMSLGKGAVLSKSTKQKLNTRSLTKSELVGAYDMLGLLLWCKYFLEAQGFSI